MSGSAVIHAIIRNSQGRTTFPELVNEPLTAGAYIYLALALFHRRRTGTLIDLAATIDAMKTAGMSADDIVRALACVQSSGPTRTARQERNRRYYEAHKGEDKPSDKRLKASETSESDATTPSPKEAPHTPEEKPPSTPSTQKENPLRGQKKGSRLPDDFAPDFEFAVREGLSLSQAQTEFAKFRDFWTAKPGAGGVKLDWQATWRNWVRSALERGVGGYARAGPPARKSNPTLDAARNLMDQFNATAPSEIEGHHPAPRLVAIGGR